MTERLAAPFPYYGGKSRWIDDVQIAFGPERQAVYVEPFFGSGAMLLGNTRPYSREIVCDTSGYICNFFRAIAHDPDAVAYHADYPTIHQDLTARHRWLIQWGRENRERLSADPDWHDAKAAGWWVWGMALWIGGEWCSGGVLRKDGSPSDTRQGVKSGGGGGVSAQKINIPLANGSLYDTRPHVANGQGGQGVSAQRIGLPFTIHDTIPKITSGGGEGVNAQRINRPYATDRVADRPLSGDRLRPWFQAIAKRLEQVIVLNRDFASALTPTLLQQTASSRKSPVRVFLDPPYRTSHGRSNLYQSDADGSSEDTAERAYRWAVANGDRPGFAIVYCCGAGDFDTPAGWTKAEKTYKGVRTTDRKVPDKEWLFFSPGCYGAKQLL